MFLRFFGLGVLTLQVGERYVERLVAEANPDGLYLRRKSRLNFELADNPGVGPSMTISVTSVVTIDYFFSILRTGLHRILCYNGYQRYCHGLLVTR